MCILTNNSINVKGVNNSILLFINFSNYYIIIIGVHMVRGEKAREVLNRINIIGFTTQLQNVDTKLPEEEVKRLKKQIIEQFAFI